MNIQTLIEQDPRIQDLRKQYQGLVNEKNRLIVAISNVEADIIKASGVYETIAKEVVAKYVPQPASVTETVEPDPVEPVEEEVVEANVDDGFAEATEPTPVVPDAENVNPITEQE